MDDIPLVEKVDSGRFIDRIRHPWAHALVALALLGILITWGINISVIQKISLQQYSAFEYGPRNAGVVAFKIITIFVFFVFAFAAAQWMPLLLVPLTVIYIFILLFLLTQNCASYNMCTYDTSKQPQTTKIADIHAAFIAISDTQMISRTDDVAVNEFLVDSLNEFQARLRSGDKELAKAHPILERLMAAQAIPDKLVIGGDLTQTGRAGFSLGHANLVEDFERLYGLNKEGKANYFIYECLGNHDFDVADDADYGSKMDMSSHGNKPFAQRYIIRRNNFRRDIIHKDDDHGHYVAKIEDGVYVINLNVCFDGDGYVVTPSAKAYGSVAYLAKALSLLNTTDRYFILCHFPACNSDFDLDQSYTDITNVIDASGKSINFGGILHGHIHLKNVRAGAVGGKLRSYNLSSPIYGRATPGYYKDPNYSVHFAVFVLVKEKEGYSSQYVLDVGRKIGSREFTVKLEDGTFYK